MPARLDNDLNHDALKTFDLETYGKAESKFYKYTDHGEGFLEYLKKVQKDHTDYNTLFEEYRKEKAKEVNKDLEECFTFGKYKGKPIKDVYKEDPDYCRWAAFELSGCSRKEARVLEWFFFLIGAPAARDLQPTKSSSKWKRRKRYTRSRSRSRSRSPRRYHKW
jgi:hypothetical protein